MPALNRLDHKVLLTSLIALLAVAILAANALGSLAELRLRAAIQLRDSRQGALNADFDVGIVRAAGETASYAITRRDEYRTEAEQALQSAMVALRGLRDTLDGKAPADALESRHAALVSRQAEIFKMLESAVAVALGVSATAEPSSLHAVLDRVFAYEPLADALRKDIAAHRDLEYVADEQEVEAAVRNTLYAVTAVVIFFLVMNAATLVAVRRHIVRPIRRLAMASSAVARGDLRQSVPVTSADEIGSLQQAFNNMVSELSAQNTALKQRNEELAVAISSLTRAHDELQHSRDQARSFAMTLNVRVEDERARIARELHDELGQVFTGLDMDLAWLRGEIAAASGNGNPRAIDRKVETMSQVIANAITEVRRLARDLRPPLLDNLGLVAALEAQVIQFQERTGVQCDTAFDASVMLGRDASIVLFRICQEALTNIARHANATSVELLLTRLEDGALSFEVRDDGRGMTPVSTGDPASVGLTGMRERARSIGGTIEIESAPGEGTVVRFALPAGPGLGTRA